MLFGIVTWLPLLVLGLVVIDKAAANRRPADAETLLRQDTRAPVLYLRAFRNAGADAIRTPLNVAKAPAKTDEERLAVVMNQVGPFIAISEPRGKTDFGAARLFVSDEEWQAKVLLLMANAQLILIRIDPLIERWGHFHKDTQLYQLTNAGGLSLRSVPEPNDFIPMDVPSSVWWEIAQAIKVKPERTLLYLPFKAKKIEREAIYEDIARLLQKSVKARLPKKIGRGEFIGFSRDGMAYVLDHKPIRMFGVVNRYGKTLGPFLKNIGVGPIRTSIDYFRIVELILNWTSLLLILITVASILLKGIAVGVLKYYPDCAFEYPEMRTSGPNKQRF